MKMLFGNLILLAIFLFASKVWAYDCVEKYLDANDSHEAYELSYYRTEETDAWGITKKVNHVVFSNTDITLEATETSFMGENGEERFSFWENKAQIYRASVESRNKGEDFFIIILKGNFETWSQTKKKVIPYDVKVLLIRNRSNDYEEFKLKSKSK